MSSRILLLVNNLHLVTGQKQLYDAFKHIDITAKPQLFIDKKTGLSQCCAYLNVDQSKVKHFINSNFLIDNKPVLVTYLKNNEFPS